MVQLQTQIKRLSLGPENSASAYYRHRGEAYARKGKYAEAIADFEKYLELGGGEKHGRTAEVEDKIRELKQKLGIK